MFYWVVRVVVFYITASIRAGRDEIFDHHLRSFTNCMAGGNLRDHDCHSLRLDVESETNPAVDVFSIISRAILNFASLFCDTVPNNKEGSRKSCKEI